MRPLTIFARSTGALPSAIAIVRVSGSAASVALEALAGTPKPLPRTAAVRTLRHPQSGVPIDRALVLWMPGPATVTGEDMVEFHVHGGRAVVAAVEAALGCLDGLTPAAPGEFTARAFENGRLDLSQVEGLADLLSAQTERQRVAALAMSEGGLRRQVIVWQEELIALAARVEALIDFADEGDVALDPAIAADITGLAAKLADAGSSPPAERLHDGVRVALAGPPNAGKSTLLNALAGREAAIASPTAGTTRDLIEVPLVLDGVPIILTDMAGVRDDATDDVERIGVARARNAIALSDLTVWLGDAAVVPSGEAITIGTKSDLYGAGKGALMSVSAKTGEGLDALRQLIVARASALLPTASALALSTWQIASVKVAAAAVEEAAEHSDIVLSAEALRTAMRALDRITGAADTEVMLDTLFARFCIGK